MEAQLAEAQQGEVQQAEAQQGEVQQGEVQLAEVQLVELQHQFQFLQQLFTSKSHQVGEIILMPMFIQVQDLQQQRTINGLE